MDAASVGILIYGESAAQEKELYENCYLYLKPGN
jgi:hypothetical protein